MTPEHFVCWVIGVEDEPTGEYVADFHDVYATTVEQAAEIHVERMDVDELYDDERAISIGVRTAAGKRFRVEVEVEFEIKTCATETVPLEEVASV